MAQRHRKQLNMLGMIIVGLVGCVVSLKLTMEDITKIVEEINSSPFVNLLVVYDTAKESKFGRYS